MGLNLLWNFTRVQFKRYNLKKESNYHNCKAKQTSKKPIDTSPKDQTMNFSGRSRFKTPTKGARKDLLNQRKMATQIEQMMMQKTRMSLQSNKTKALKKLTVTKCKMLKVNQACKIELL